MREITINDVRYEIGLSFYRTHGSVNQQYYEAFDVALNKDDPSLFTGRVFHYVKRVPDGKPYFIKEYLIDKYMATEEYKISLLFSDNNNVMDIFEIDDGKLLCEYVPGVQLSKLGTVSIKHLKLAVIELIAFVEMFKEKGLSHLIELNLNNTLLQFNEKEQRYKFKIIDLETNILRYNEFTVKNNEF